MHLPTGDAIPLTKRKLAVLAAKIVATAIIAVSVLGKIDIAGTIVLIRSADFAIILLGAAVSIGTLGLGALRWGLLLRAHDARVNLRAAATYTYIGQFINTLLPSTIGGDFARALYAIRRGGRAPSVVLTLALDRMLGVAGAVALTALIIFFQPLGIALPDSWRSFAAVVLVTLIGACPLAFLLQRMVTSPAMIRRASSRWPRLADALPLLRLRVSSLLAAFGVSLLVLLTIGGTLACADAALGTNGLGPWRAVALAGPLLLATSLPISFAGWGVREAVLVTLFQYLELPAELGLATSVLYGLVLTSAGLPGFVLWLRFRHSTTA